MLKEGYHIQQFVLANDMQKKKYEKEIHLSPISRCVPVTFYT